MRLWLPAILTAMAALLFVAPAQASTIHVGSPAGFQEAVSALRKSGGTIVLRPGTYKQELVIGSRSQRRLYVTGSSGTVVRELLLDHAQSVTVSRVSFRAMTRDGGVHAAYSRHLTFRNLGFSALETRRKVELNLDHSSHVHVEDSRFAHCGDDTPRWSMCLLPLYATFVTIEDNTFHDCRGCDFIHGRAGRHLVIRGNRFDRALACHHTWVKCGHQDMIELFRADGMVVRDNIFGVNERGGAQLYMALEVDHVKVLDNLFLAHDPLAPTVVPHVGILVGTKASVRVPHDVEIINNTILSGAAKSDHAANSIVLSHRYAMVRESNRPLIANNILATQLAPRLVCPWVRGSRHNVVEQGPTCRSTDAAGDAELTGVGHPTAASTLVIDRADPALAPRLDLLGHHRHGPPDIGAFEYIDTN